MSVLRVSRAISYRPCSTSLIALSNSTLSGCWVLLVIGFSYFLRWNPQEADSPATSTTTAPYVNRFR